MMKCKVLPKLETYGKKAKVNFKRLSEGLQIRRKTASGSKRR